MSVLSVTKRKCTLIKKIYLIIFLECLVRIQIFIIIIFIGAQFYNKKSNVAYGDNNFSEKIRSSHVTSHVIHFLIFYNFSIVCYCFNNFDVTRKTKKVPN